MIQAGARMLLKVKKVSEKAVLPVRAHENDAGLDLYALEDVQIDNDLLKVKTGIAVELPPGSVGLILDRSSMALKGFNVYGGVIDSGYRGEIIVILSRSVSDIDGTYYYDPFDKSNSHSFASAVIKAGTKIAQLVILPILSPTVYEVKELSNSDREDKAFGSTGV